MSLRFLLLPLLILPHFLQAQRAVRPDARINSDCEERQPVLSPDGKTLYFWRRDCPDNTAGFRDPGDIWVSTRDAQGRWSPAKRLDAPLNGKGHDFVWQVSRRHDTLFVMQNAPGVQEPGIAYSVRVRGSDRWTAPVPMHIRDFEYRGGYKDYFRTAQNRLLLPNNGSPSYGGSDLYFCRPLNDTAWSRPINLGPDINTAGDEDAPFLAPDNKTLYFNSNGHGDGPHHKIYMSRRLDDSWQRWTKPELLPPPINSSGSDFDFHLSADGREAWWCSNLGTLGSNDIFSLDLSTCEVDLYPDGELTLCKGESVELVAGFTTRRDVEYQWYKNGTPIRGGYNGRLRVDSDGDYMVMRRSDGCEARSLLREVRFVDPPAAAITSGEGCLDDSLQLQALGTGNGFQWFKNGLPIPEATRRHHWAHGPGTYTVTVARGQCETTSAPTELRSFTPPILYTEEDSLRGWLPILPRWQWTNKVKPPKGDTYVSDLTTGPRGELYVVTQTLSRGQVQQRISSYFPSGLERDVIHEGQSRNPGTLFLATDPDGNLLVTSREEYLRKYRPDGMTMWWKDEQRQNIIGLCTDLLGNIYTAGRFRDSTRIGKVVLAAPDRGAIFLAKHSPRGELLWAKSFAVDQTSYDFGNALSSDCEGNVYLAGNFDLVADFGRHALRGTLLMENVFVAKFNPEGQAIFAKKVNTERTRVRSGDVHVECNGQITLLLNREYVLLDYNGRETWRGALLMPEGSYALSHRVVAHQGDATTSGFTADGRYFVSKLNGLRNQVLLWQDRGAATSERDQPAISIDEEGGIAVAGVSRGNHFQGAQFDLTSGSPVFLMKYARPMVEAVTREPLSLCGGKPVVLLARQEPGLQYQWLRDGREISGATVPAYRATRAGTYQLKATLGACNRVSDPQVVTECGQDPVAAATALPPEPAPPAVEAPPVSRTTPAPAPSPPSDLSTGLSGKPRALRGRRVKSQDKISLASRDVTILVWDHGAVDLDTVSINLNGTWLLEYHGLTKEPLQIDVTLEPGDNYLMLYAHNLGTTPPNTAAIQVSDGVVRKTLQLRSNLRNCGMLKITVE